MPRSPFRPAAAVAVVALLSLLPACTAAGSAPTDPPAEVAAPAGHRTRIEVRLPGGSMVTEVLHGADRAHARSWSEATDRSAGEPQALLEEVRIGDDHWVQLPALVTEGILEPGWIHFDLSDPIERRWLEANAIGLIDQHSLWSARPGDTHGDDEIVAVDEPAPGQRVLRLASGLELHVTRELLHTAPDIALPDALPVVPFRDVERLLAPS